MIGSDGTFSGYACKWDELARSYGEVVAPTAFDSWLAEREMREQEGGECEVIPVLWNHDTDEPIGLIHEVRLDDVGMYVTGKIVVGTERGKDAVALMMEGALRGLSMGFTATRVEAGDPAVITEAQLSEVSVVSFPAIEGAQVDSMFRDNITLDSSSIRKTADGFLAVNARVARAGIQVYKGYEMGRPDMKEVRVYRPPDEVFSKDAMHSFAHRPVTLDHPSEAVNAKNWRKLAVGQTGDEVVRDGDFVRVPLVLMDANAIDRVESGVRELSMGYTTELKWESGLTQDGQPYDAVQTAIRANHLAVVAAARGGPKLRIGDIQALDEEGDQSMNTAKTTTFQVDGIPVEMTDVSASVVQRALGTLEDRIKKLRAELDEAEAKKKKAEDSLATADAAHKTAVEAKDGEIAVLKKKVEDSAITPAKLDALVKDRQSVIDAALSVDEKIVVDGKTLEDIRRSAVAVKLGDAVAKDMSDAAIEGAFKALTADGTTRADDGAGVRQFARALGSTRRQPVADKRDDAYVKSVDRLQNAWKGDQGKLTA